MPWFGIGNGFVNLQQWDDSIPNRRRDGTGRHPADFYETAANMPMSPFATLSEPALPAPAATSLTLEHGRQRLRLLPEFGGSIAAWEMRPDGSAAWQHLLRQWKGSSVAPADAYTFACFPLVPWSNRIGGGGFEQAGRLYALRPNRAGEPFPIHGDGWLQSWTIDQTGDDHIALTLTSNGFDGSPYHYRASQRFSMGKDSLTIRLEVTHLGDDPLPYGLGLHPYFPRNAKTTLQMDTTGLWLCGDDPMPVSHTTRYPPSFDYRQPTALDGPLIDHCFTGWDGHAVISYPDRGLRLTLTMRDCNGYALMYRPPDLDFFCLEPITHPIDAFHMPGRPGLQILACGQSMALELVLRFQGV